MSEYVTVKEAAELIGIGPDWLFTLYRHGRIPGAQRIAREVVLPREWAEAEARRRGAETITLRDAAALAGVPKYILQAAARRGQIVQAGFGRYDRASVLAYIAEREAGK